MKKGYLQVYTGNGKGKTTASLGLAVRAAGSGLNVVIAQFLKAIDTGELKIFNNIDNITVMRYSTIKKFVWDMNDEEKHTLKDQMQKLLNDTIAFSQQNNTDVVIFDELLGALHGGFISKEEIMDLIEGKPQSREYIITGRAAPEWLIEKADLVSEVMPVKHYMDAGVIGRKGIEF